MFGDTRALRATALCLRSSARDPPGVRLLLQTKAKVPFNRAVTELSNRFFPVFQGANPAQFQPLSYGFSVSGRQRVAKEARSQAKY
jgi:hypothetical protein